VVNLGFKLFTVLYWLLKTGCEPVGGGAPENLQQCLRNLFFGSANNRLGLPVLSLLSSAITR